MKKKVILFFICISQISFAQSKKDSIPDNDIQLNKTVIDFGCKYLNEIIEGTFVITNNSNEPLIIKDVQASSTNFIPDYSRNIILKGKTGFINIHYPSNYVGVFNKNITIKTNKGIKQVYIKGNIQDYCFDEYWKINKTKIDLGNVVESFPGEYISFELINISTDTLEILKVSYNAAGCGLWDRNKEILPNQQTKITIQVNTQGRVGPINGFAYITTNKGEKILTLNGSVLKANK